MDKWSSGDAALLDAKVFQILLKDPASPGSRRLAVCFASCDVKLGVTTRNFAVSPGIILN